MPIGYPLVKAMDNNRFISYFLINNALLNERVIFFCNYDDPTDESVYIGMLLFLESENADKPITFYINSSVNFPNLCFGLYDTMLQIKPDLITICSGLAGGMSSLILAAGKKSQRFALPYSRIMIQEPQLETGVSGQATDLDIESKELANIRQILVTLYHQRTFQPKERINKDLLRPYYFSAVSAKEYGLIDGILKPAK